MGRFRANVGRFRANVGRIWSMSVQIWSTVRRFRPTMVGVSPSFNPTSVKLYPESAKVGRCRPGHLWMKPGHGPEEHDPRPAQAPAPPDIAHNFACVSHTHSTNTEHDFSRSGGPLGIHPPTSAWFSLTQYISVRSSWHPRTGCHSELQVGLLLLWKLRTWGSPRPLQEAAYLLRQAPPTSQMRCACCEGCARIKGSALDSGAMVLHRMPSLGCAMQPANRHSMWPLWRTHVVSGPAICYYCAMASTEASKCWEGSRPGAAAKCPATRSIRRRSARPDIPPLCGGIGSWVCLGGGSSRQDVYRGGRRPKARPAGLSPEKRRSRLEIKRYSVVRQAIRRIASGPRKTTPRPMSAARTFGTP